MSKIERVEKSVETKEVETSKTITVYACDICGHEYEDESELSELHKNPSVRGRYNSLKELSEVIDVMHFRQDAHALDSLDNHGHYELLQQGRPLDLITGITDELEAVRKSNGWKNGNQPGRFDTNASYTNYFGTDKYHKTRGSMLELFIYEVSIEPTSDERYDVCDDCYSVVFDDA